MTPARFQALTAQYPWLRIVVVGDVCLDRYLEIDPARAETSIETGLEVHNVVNVRAQPGGAGTILNNLAALGVGTILPVGFCGDDGEGYELRRALAALPGVKLDHFATAPDRRTFTYCKPLVCRQGEPPRELNRLDSKNWTPTPAALVEQLLQGLRQASEDADAVIVLEQVDRADTGVITGAVREAIGWLAATNPGLPVLADSRRGLKGWPAVSFKMNAAELASLIDPGTFRASDAPEAALALAARTGRPVFVTLAERGIIAASPDGAVEHVPALPVRGPIDIVGAGDSVTANLAAALAAGATLREAVELAAVASSIVIHKLGTTGTASVPEMEMLLNAVQ
jgi:rfaE bifunctional protein kinase chain/domain